MAHQAHALPWKTLVDHFKYMNPKWKYDSTWDIYSLGKPRQESDIAHFARVLAKQIQRFGITERAKYDSAEIFKERAATWIQSQLQEVSTTMQNREVASSVSNSRREANNCVSTETKMVIPQDVIKWYTRQASPESQNHTLQNILSYEANHRIENWIGSYLHIIEGNIVKLLMTEAAFIPPAKSASDYDSNPVARECMDTLLLLSNHPQLELVSLQHQHHGHHFGVSRVAEEGLSAYVHLNVLFAMSESGSDIFDVADIEGDSLETTQRKKYMETKSYMGMLYNVAGSYDGDAHTTPHRWFFLSQRGTYPVTGNFVDWRESKASKDVMADTAALREYLKGVWRLLVIYDVVIREAGGDPDWEQEFQSCLRAKFGMKSARA